MIRLLPERATAQASVFVTAMGDKKLEFMVQANLHKLPAPLSDWAGEEAQLLLGCSEPLARARGRVCPLPSGAQRAAWPVASFTQGQTSADAARDLCM